MSQLCSTLKRFSDAPKTTHGSWGIVNYPHQRPPLYLAVHATASQGGARAARLVAAIGSMAVGRAAAVLWAAALLLCLGQSSWLSRVHAAAPRPDERSWTSNLMASTLTPYNKSAAECYALNPPRNKTVVLTALLDDYHPKYFSSEWMSRLSSSLNNLTKNNPVDIIFFHTGWTDEQEAQLTSREPRVRLACIATEHWRAERNFHAWWVEATAANQPTGCAAC